MKLGLGRTFSHFNELLKCDSFYFRVTCSCLCFQFLPPLRATGFQFEEVPPVPSALSVIGLFFPERLFSFGHILTKPLYLGFWLNIFVSWKGQWSWYRNRKRQQQTCENISCPSAGCVTHPVLEESLLSFSIAVHSSGMEPHLHYLKLMLADNSLWAFGFFFKGQK